MGASELIDRVTGHVAYLRVSAGQDSGESEWLSCEPLVTEPDAILELARSTAAGRGTELDAVAMSLLVQGYAFRVASIAIGAWLVGDQVLDVAPAHMSIAIGRDRPNAVRFDPLRLVTAADSLAALHAELIDHHLAPLVANAHRACRIGERLLWANVGASCASSFRAFVDPLPEQRQEIEERAAAFFSTARAELADSGRLVTVGTDWAWERQACCLWYQASGGGRCDDCSLWTVGERQARYQEQIATQDRSTQDSEATS